MCFNCITHTHTFFFAILIYFLCVSSALEGNGVELSHLLRLAFSVLNRLLLLRPDGAQPSPVEHALSARPAGHSHRHVVATVACYVYHRHDPRLPTLAALLLKRLAMVSLIVKKWI